MPEWLEHDMQSPRVTFSLARYKLPIHFGTSVITLNADNVGDF
jgi:hypothetical protein